MRSNNSVKEAAATGKQIRGVHLTFAAPAIIEVLAAVDIQFVYIDGELAALPGVDYMSFGMLDLAQSLGHPGNPDHGAVKSAVADASGRIRAAGKRVREDFMKFVWINDVLLTGARHLLDS